MTWHWRLLARDGSEWHGDVYGAQLFPSQADAETWLGESWRELRDHGVAAVVLLQDEREVYGPMALDPA